MQIALVVIWTKLLLVRRNQNGISENSTPITYSQSHISGYFRILARGFIYLVSQSNHIL